MRTPEELAAEWQSIVAAMTLDRALLGAEIDRLNVKMAGLEEALRRASSDAHHWEAVATNAQEELTAALAKIARMREVLQEIETEGYMAELIAHKVVSGLRCREEQECYAKLQALLKDEP